MDVESSAPIVLDVSFDESPITLDVPFGGSMIALDVAFNESPIVDTGWSPQESSTALFPSVLLFPSESLYLTGVPS